MPKIIGMSAPEGLWATRLAEVGPCGINARRVFADLTSSGEDQSDIIEAAITADMLPIISYKVPSVATLLSGGYDSWLENLHDYLDGLATEVTVTFWHEPHGDMSAANFRDGSQKFLDIVQDTNIKVGPILNGWLLDTPANTATFATYTSPTLLAAWDFVAVDTYQNGSLASPGAKMPGRAVPLLEAWLDDQGFPAMPIGVGEYNGFTTEAVEAGGEYILSSTNLVWGLVWNSSGGLGVPLSGTRLAAFQATKSDIRAENDCIEDPPPDPIEPEEPEPEPGVPGTWVYTPLDMVGEPTLRVGEVIITEDQLEGEDEYVTWTMRSYRYDGDGVFTPGDTLDLIAAFPGITSLDKAEGAQRTLLPGDVFGVVLSTEINGAVWTMVSIGINTSTLELTVLDSAEMPIIIADWVKRRDVYYNGTTGDVVGLWTTWVGSEIEVCYTSNIGTDGTISSWTEEGDPDWYSGGMSSHEPGVGGQSLYSSFWYDDTDIVSADTIYLDLTDPLHAETVTLDTSMISAGLTFATTTWHDRRRNGDTGEQLLSYAVFDGDGAYTEYHLLVDTTVPTAPEVTDWYHLTPTGGVQTLCYGLTRLGDGKWIAIAQDLDIENNFVGDPYAVIDLFGAAEIVECTVPFVDDFYHFPRPFEIGSDTEYIVAMFDANSDVQRNVGNYLAVFVPDEEPPPSSSVSRWGSIPISFEG